MPIREEKVFSDEEMIAAFEIILPPEEAREEGLAFNSLPDLHFEDPTPEEFARVQGLGPRSYNHDFLDLLSLVSDSCAERAWRLMGVSAEEGERRREAFRRRIDEARRAER
jgi:hypothetical protein